MARFGLMIAASAGLALPLCAQGGITIKTKEGTVESHGEANKAEAGDAMRRPDTRGNPEEIAGFIREVSKARAENFADGDLTQEEINRLVEKAREKLEKDMAKLQERERENRAETDPEDRAEVAEEISEDRYRNSLRALERDLLYSVERLRKPGGDQYEGELDNMEDKVKDTFADLNDQIEDGTSVTWAQTLDTARKFHTEFHSQIDKWATKIGINPDIPNAKERIVDMKKSLRGRISRLRKVGGDRYADQLEDVEERVLENYEALEEKLEDAAPAAWATIVKDGEKFFAAFNAELDGWAKKIGGDEALPSPLERLAELKRDLKGQIKDLRRIGGDDYEDVIDEIADSVDDVFADLKDKALDQPKEGWAATLETAAKYHRQFSETINMWERKIVGASDKIERKYPETPNPDVGPRPDYPEKDIKLPKGEQMDIVDGVRVSRLMPMPKKQLGLENGLSVNEIVDADGALARAGLEVYDIIIKVNDKSVDTRTELRDQMNDVKRGSEYSIEVMRDGKIKTLKSSK